MGRERYYLQRDEAQSRRDIRESEERAARSRGGINGNCNSIRIFNHAR